MKIRSDFVSNSSSSSFIFSANFNKFKFKDFVKLVCDNCNGSDSANESKYDCQIRQKNTAILQYCLRYFELLHLGTIINGKNREIIRRGYDNGKKIENADDLTYSEFEMLKREFIDNNYASSHMTGETVKMIDNDTLEYEYNNEMPSNVIVTSEYMSNVIRSDWYYGNKSKTDIRKDRAEKIMKVLELVKNFEADRSLVYTPYCAETYLITKNTIANTRDLIACGYKIEFCDWENLDALDARLSAGETIFHTTCGDSGEGEGDSRLYSCNTQNPFHTLPLESITVDN